MSIQLYVSNSLPNLAKQLSEDLGKQHLGVFDQQQIITQTEGMNTWLKIKIANQLGITANCFFSKPNDIVSKIYYLLGGNSKPILSVDFIKWNIYHLLNEHAFVQKFPAIASYYENNDIKQIALANKVADLFDQYQVYRPDIILEWNMTDINSISDNWQQWLWSKIYKIVDHKMLDKTSIIQYIIDALKEPGKQTKLQLKLPELKFFGIAVITPIYLKLFNELSKYITISFYLLNPAPNYYWLDDKSEKQISKMMQKVKRKPQLDDFSAAGNSLLNSWGTIIKESFSLLFEDEANINNYDDSLVQEPLTPTSLLKKIQHDIFHNAPLNERNKIEKSEVNDGSIVINACFTPVREVEVLYNYLVQLVDQNKEKFSPRDIVVMVSNIDSYAPYIRAIFDNAPYTFPYTIADESISVGNSMFNAIELILNIQLESFKAEEVLELLDSKYIRERFSIKDLQSIRKVVDGANIRFGLEGENENETRLVSWHYGLKRIMYGICISGEPLLELDNDVLIPLDMVEGAESQELVHFWYFMQVLEETVHKRSAFRSIAEWGAYLQELVENLVFQSGEKEDEDYHRLITYLEKLTLLENISNEPISYDVFRHSFLDILNNETKANSFASAGITFCSLIPMRSIPFKVVAILGMDFDKFPRKETKLSFNLLDKQRRKGDRNVKDNDKHLFLETLLSAEKYFYISFIGTSVKDGTKIPPSTLVDELIEYVLAGIETKDEKLKDLMVSKHPLHGFSQLYFNNSGLVSYLGDEKHKHKEPVPIGMNEDIQLDFEEISVSDLQKFFKEPLKWYFNKVFGIYYRDEQLLLPDTEVFEFDNLGSWQIKNDLYKISDEEYDSYYERNSKLGLFPLKNMGKISFNLIVEEVRPNKERLNILRNGMPETPREINLRIGQHTVTGVIINIYGDRFIIYSDSKNFKKHLVEAYVCYIIALADGLELEFNFLLFAYKKDFKILKGAISRQEALQCLETFVDYFKSGYIKPFLFYPAFLKSPFDLFAGDAFDFMHHLQLMQKSLYDYTFNDPYFQKAYDNNLFDEYHYEELKSNTINIFQQIDVLMPGIFKLKGD